MKVNAGDLAALNIGEDLVCAECFTDEELHEAKADQLPLTKHIEEGDELALFYCDRCGERIN